MSAQPQMAEIPIPTLLYNGEYRERNEKWGEKRVKGDRESAVNDKMIALSEGNEIHPKRGISLKGRQNLVKVEPEFNQESSNSNRPKSIRYSVNDQIESKEPKGMNSKDNIGVRSKWGRQDRSTYLRKELDSIAAHLELMGANKPNSKKQTNNHVRVFGAGEGNSIPFGIKLVKNNSNLPMIIMKICGREALTLFDTGASHSLVSSSFLNSCGREVPKIRKIFVQSPISEGLSQAYLDSFLINIEGREFPWEASVTDISASCRFEAILGYDFIEKYNLILDPVKGIIWVNELWSGSSFIPAVGEDIMTTSIGAINPNQELAGEEKKSKMSY